MKFLPIVRCFVFLLSCMAVSGFAEDSNTTLSVYKNAQCGCCGGWVKHMEATGFHVEPHNLEADALNNIKNQHAIKPLYQSCHTAVFDNEFVFEGHIPAKLIERFLKEKPEGAIGLAVPGMPVGSPGMEMGERFSPYDVLLLKSDGSHEVFAHVSRYEEQF